MPVGTLLGIIEKRRISNNQVEITHHTVERVAQREGHTNPSVLRVEGTGIECQRIDIVQGGINRQPCPAQRTRHNNTARPTATADVDQAQRHASGCCGDHGRQMG